MKRPEKKRYPADPTEATNYTPSEVFKVPAAFHKQVHDQNLREVLVGEMHAATWYVVPEDDEAREILEHIPEVRRVVQYDLVEHIKHEALRQRPIGGLWEFVDEPHREHLAYWAKRRRELHDPITPEAAEFEHYTGEVSS